MSQRRVFATLALLAAVLALPAASQTPGAARRAGVGFVDWQAATVATRRAANQSLGRVDRAAVDRTAVPILLPDDAALLANARLYSFGDYYSLTADLPGAGVSFTGTTAVVALPDRSPLRIDATAPELLTVQRTVDGQLASFVRFGVLYTVELRCDDPADPRCRNEALVRQLVASANRVVMGQAARQAAAGQGG
ncbi:MAG TPA: hypothetical protein VEA44_04070 [Caulobacter sp.]|nr:hypothetical protein [Caulobacter sp.]